MTYHTSIDELYSTYGALIQRGTGRPWWRKAGIQARPKTPYATLYLAQAQGYENPIVENATLSPLAEDGERFEQVPWCLSLIDVQIEFFGDRPDNTALQAAQRFRSSLYLTAREWDISAISALASRVQIQDLSVVFREDVEPRTQVTFQITANVVEPLPLADTKIFDISHQRIGVTHVGIDNVETPVDIITIDDNESDSS